MYLIKKKTKTKHRFHVKSGKIFMITMQSVLFSKKTELMGVFFGI